MVTNRRNLLIGAASALAATSFGAAPALAGNITREFQAFRGRTNFGGQVIKLSEQGSSVVVDLHSRLKGRIIVFSLDYELRSQEVWKDGVLQSITGNTTENGKKSFVKAQRVAEGLQVESSKFNGVVTGEIASSSFFLSELALRDRWISTQSGRVLSIETTKRGDTTFETPGGVIPVSHYYCGGDLKLPVDAYFDGDGELVGYEFDAVGARARIVAKSTTQKFRSLWG
jgi:hypothetical protein